MLKDSNSINEDATMVAIYPPDEVIEKIDGEFGDSILEQGPHITLGILGSTTPEEFVEAVKIMQDVSDELTPIEVEIEGPGLFRGPDADVKLALVNGVGLDLWSLKARSNLKSHNLLEEEKHGFLPHMTLEYLDDRSPEEDWEDPILEFAEDTSWVCDTISLSRGRRYPD